MYECTRSAVRRRFNGFDNKVKFTFSTIFLCSSVQCKFGRYICKCMHERISCALYTSFMWRILWTVKIFSDEMGQVCVGAKVCISRNVLKCTDACRFSHSVQQRRRCRDHIIRFFAYIIFHFDTVHRNMVQVPQVRLLSRCRSAVIAIWSAIHFCCDRHAELEKNNECIMNGFYWFKILASNASYELFILRMRSTNIASADNSMWYIQNSIGGCKHSAAVIMLGTSNSCSQKLIHHDWIKRRK